MREHGIDMPDPQRVGTGGIKLSGGKVNFNDPKMKSAQSACQKYMQIGGGETIDPAKRAKLQESALNYARCMRGHGVDMPDPKLSGDGGLTFQAGPGPKSANNAGPRGAGGQPRLAEVQVRRQGVQPLPGRPPRCRPEHGGAEMSVAARRGARGPVSRRGGRVAVAVIAVAGAAAVAWLLLAPADRHGTEAANDAAVPLGAAAVERRDLVDRQDVDGTLGFSATTKATAPTAGTITRLRDEGDTVTRGRSLMSLDAKATAWVLYGTIPMYRDLGPAVSNGRDVRQLERNLTALGYDPGTVDDDWTSATTDAVVDFQADRGLTESGTIERSQFVVSDGPARVGEHSAEVGDPARAGAPVTGLTSTTPVVTAKLDAGFAADVHRGDAVRVTLADGSEVGGKVSSVGTVATAGQNGASPTVDLRVALDRGRHGRLDGAPVSVSLETGRTKDALAVPVTALVATAPGRYAVELGRIAAAGRRDPRRLRRQLGAGHGPGPRARDAGGGAADEPRAA